MSNHEAHALIAADAAAPDTPTACAGWTAHELVAHLAAGSRRSPTSSRSTCWTARPPDPGLRGPGGTFRACPGRTSGRPGWSTACAWPRPIAALDARGPARGGRLHRHPHDRDAAPHARSQRGRHPPVGRLR